MNVARIIAASRSLEIMFGGILGTQGQSTIRMITGLQILSRFLGGRPNCRFHQADCSAGNWVNILKPEGGKPQYLGKFMSGSKVNLSPAPNRQKLSKYGRNDSKNGNFEFPK
jgi:hypothetical protein